MNKYKELFLYINLSWHFPETMYSKTCMVTATMIIMISHLQLICDFHTLYSFKTYCELIGNNELHL